MESVTSVTANRLIVPDLMNWLQCEERFRGRTELATEYDERVVDLCQVWEAVFSHGLKRNRSLLKITKDIATKGLSRAAVTGETVTFWHFVRHFLNKHDHDRYMMLKNVHVGTSREAFDPFPVSGIAILSDSASPLPDFT